MFAQELLDSWKFSVASCAPYDAYHEILRWLDNTVGCTDRLVTSSFLCKTNKWVLLRHQSTWVLFCNDQVLAAAFSFKW